MNAYIGKKGQLCCANPLCRQRFGHVMVAPTFDGTGLIVDPSFIRVEAGWKRHADGVFRMTNKRRRAADRKQPMRRRRKPDSNVREVDAVGGGNKRG